MGSVFNILEQNPKNRVKNLPTFFIFVSIFIQIKITKSVQTNGGVKKEGQNFRIYLFNYYVLV